ncbi:MAG: hypothetical protein M1827_005016 [Pycnora praestabilis]|nr:MAG: hypothetical protein M1827_005016 [Pycnora praestabilis]
MNVTRALRMQPTSRMMFQSTRGLRMQPTRRMLAVPKEEHSAHTISQRLRTLRKIPPELIPLGIVLGIAIIAAGYSIVAKLFVDKSLRLTRSNRKKED